MVCLKKKFSIGYLYFILPFLAFFFLNFSREFDFWFLLAHGRYVLSNGFPHVEFLTIHSGLHFVMQQWASSVLLYSIYQYFGSVGIIFLLFLIDGLFLYSIYHFCLFLSLNNSYVSCFISSIVVVFFELFFLVPRPQIFSLFLFLIVTILFEKYSFHHQKIYLLFLPIISFFLIQLHASMWPILLVLFLPYLVEYSFLFIVKKQKNVLKDLFLLLISFLVSFLFGFLNPYGWEAMTYSFRSYGISDIFEMHPFSFVGDFSLVFVSVSFLIFFLFEGFLIFRFPNKFSYHTILLFLGLSFMSFINVRNVSLFIVLIFPYTVCAFPAYSHDEILVPIIWKILILFVCCFSVLFCYRDYSFDIQSLQNVRSILNQYSMEDVVLFTPFSEGSYFEYYGYSSYIDSRAEVFLKVNNYKKDILLEYIDVLDTSIDYDAFLRNYSFTHLLTKKNMAITSYLYNHNQYSILYQDEFYVLFIHSSEEVVL